MTVSSFDISSFGGHQVPEDGVIKSSCLSQWYPAAFELEGIVYPTAEHWMMASKARQFGDDGILQQILESTDPKTAKALGRNVKNFDDDVWKSNCRRLVTEGNVAKFSQNESLRTFLIGTEDHVIVEASPFDRIWGNGLSVSNEKSKHPSTWLGQNLLGFALMDVRERLAG